MNRVMDLEVWRLFVESVRSGSVYSACEKLDLEPSTASRAIKALERDMGMTLFQRSTRPVTLTPMGTVAYEEAVKLLQQHTRMMARLRNDLDDMSGMIRVATYAGIGALEVTPLLVKFQQTYPDIEFDLVELTQPAPQGFIDSDGKGVDVIVGYGHGDIAGIRSWYLGEMPFICCASPQYLRRHGRPVSPDDSVNHIGLTYVSAFRKPIAALVRDGHSLPLKWRKTITFHSVLSLKNALVLGAGICTDLSLYHNLAELKDGTLEPVMDHWSAPTKSCFVMVQEDSLRCRKVAVFAEWLAQKEKEMMDNMRRACSAWL
ncbi:MAG TPA: LysR family transcriptional regulator [Candidatus Aphodousia gallistercoris]|nr:LysR family transcriptional regulator [Candidatus Aphodousia gallistercoris]